jgi:hypothetical protein
MFPSDRPIIITPVKFVVFEREVSFVAPKELRIPTYYITFCKEGK